MGLGHFFNLNREDLKRESWLPGARFIGCTWLKRQWMMHRAALMALCIYSYVLVSSKPNLFQNFALLLRLLRELLQSRSFFP